MYNSATMDSKWSDTMMWHVACTVIRRHGMRLQDTEQYMLSVQVFKHMLVEGVLTQWYWYTRCLVTVHTRR